MKEIKTLAKMIEIMENIESKLPFKYGGVTVSFDDKGIYLSNRKNTKALKKGAGETDILTQLMLTILEDRN